MAKKKKNDPKAYRFIIPYTDTVDMAKKVLLFYNGYLNAIGKSKCVIDTRHINLMSYYFVFGYSYETKKKYSHCFDTEMRYIAVLDTELRKRDLLVDTDGTFRSRSLSQDLENMRRLFIIEGSRDISALALLFTRSK